MKMRLIFVAVVYGSLLGPSPCIADDGSARRYAEFVECDDLSRMFSLLERKDVQDELKITPKQIAEVEHICHAPMQDIPGLQELMANYKKRQSDPALSPLDKEKLRESLNSDIGKCIKAYQRKKLSATLSAYQKQRLSELLIQMRGPIILVDDPDIASKVRLSGEQMTEMKQVVKHYEAGLRFLQSRYGRRQISAKRRNETPEDRKEELEALFAVIRGIEREGDYDLLLGLKPQQHLLWESAKGAPFPIEWPPASLYHDPFAKQDITVEREKGKK